MSDRVFQIIKAGPLSVDLTGPDPLCESVGTLMLKPGQFPRGALVEEYTSVGGARLTVCARCMGQRATMRHWVSDTMSDITNKTTNTFCARFEQTTTCPPLPRGADIVRNLCPNEWSVIRVR